ncbi:MAG: leucine-rich repeat domain-containing protein [Ruminococcaceae bacterium]|nr:leucine-rich repeat domain-containing protein [Oscillospiraceae bacterium]
MRKALLVFCCIFLVFALLAAGCGEAAPAPTPLPTATPEPTPEPTPAPTPAPVELFGRSYAPDTAELDLRKESGSVVELTAALERFNALEFVDLRGWELTEEEMFALHDGFPDTVFGWEFEILGVPVSSMDEFVSFDEIRMEDVSPVESVLPLLYNMKQVDMCYCGIDDETMYEFYLRWPDVRIVWMSNIGYSPMRTDTNYFLRNYWNVNTSMISSEYLDQQLRYFPDIIALDVGHGGYRINDLSFLRHVPKLQILIAAMCNVTDVTPVGELEDLVFVELFMNPIQDFSPLAKLQNMKDLNISHTQVTDLSPFYECSALERLWLISTSPLSDEEVEAFAERKPDCQIARDNYNSATEMGWRVHERYYWVWDVLHPDWPHPRPSEQPQEE